MLSAVFVPDAHTVLYPISHGTPMHKINNSRQSVRHTDPCWRWLTTKLRVDTILFGILIGWRSIVCNQLLSTLQVTLQLIKTNFLWWLILRFVLRGETFGSQCFITDENEQTEKTRKWYSIGHNTIEINSLAWRPNLQWNMQTNCSYGKLNAVGSLHLNGPEHNFGFFHICFSPECQPLWGFSQQPNATAWLERHTLTRANTEKKLCENDFHIHLIGWWQWWRWRRHRRWWWTMMVTTDNVVLALLVLALARSYCTNLFMKLLLWIVRCCSAAVTGRKYLLHFSAGKYIFEYFIYVRCSQYVRRALKCYTHNQRKQLFTSVAHYYAFWNEKESPLHTQQRVAYNKLTTHWSIPS